MGLPRPVELKYQSLPEGVARPDLPPTPERQAFEITFDNGLEWRGETLGSVSALCGHFLYVPEDDSGVARWFVPARSLQDIRIGAPIGPCLMAHNTLHHLAAAKPQAYKNGAHPVSGEAVSVGRISAPAALELGINELTSRLAAESADQELTEHQLEHSDSTLVKLVNKLILDAVERKVSDIHIESNAGQHGTRVRFRKDGTLIDYLELPARFQRAVISRIKIMSQLDITERRKPQDGKIEFGRFGPAQVELRVATIPTRESLEDVVMRVLGASNRVPSIAELGFDFGVLASLRRLISRPQGLFLVCGPTGSGKTTTLHSLLGFINIPERKIWTAEDPIEITQAGLRQVQVHSKIGWTFAAAMRSFLRADPDVIMVGEMRDAETAKVGIEASLTGHLVLTTLHTNSAIECIIRLLDLGMDPFNFSDALLGVLAQRLAKRLCPSCKIRYAASDDELRELAEEYCIDTQLDPETTRKAWIRRCEESGEAEEEYSGAQLDPGTTRKGWSRRDAGSLDTLDTKLDPGATREGWDESDVHAGGGGVSLWRAAGCDRCDRTGYLGRMGLFELLVADPKIKRLVQSKAPMSDLKDAATAMGMHTLKQDGIERVLQGLTDIHQVRAVCG
jgi:type II secretory ATPase GspE/PulE/Tfp pilus assembly ATPase PilB-like protein